jgi:hypothetical protein
MTHGPAAARDRTSEPPGRGRRILRRLGSAALILTVTGLIAGEVVARVVLGLGDPPLFQADPEIEYLPLPGRSYNRFGNVVSFNSYSMRSPEFPARKTDARELRVMVLGDSVVNGGAPTDQADLATTKLPAMLTAALTRPAVVGNISCGSWGLPNVLAYVKRHGLFQADAAVIVVNADDAYDVPSFAPLGIELPTRSPISALVEGYTLYAPKAFRYHVLGEREGPKPPPPAEARRQALGALESLIAAARAANARPLVVYHFKLSELEAGRPEPGYEQFRGVATRAGVRFIDTREEMLKLINERHIGYRDNIHPDVAGQAALAEILAREIIRDAKDASPVP